MLKRVGRSACCVVELIALIDTMAAKAALSVDHCDDTYPSREPYAATPVLGAVVDGSALAIPACTMRRAELTKLLGDSGFGSNAPMYDGYFARSAEGHHVCLGCRKPIAAHRDDAAESLPTRTLAAVLDERTAARDTSELVDVPYPLHWSGSVWYAPLLRYMRRNGDAFTTFQCVAPHPDGEGVCGKEFREARTSPALRGLPNLVVSGTANDETVVEHMHAVHGVVRRLPGRWTTGLCRVCEHPAAACDCCCTYMLVSPCTRTGSDGFCQRADLVAVDGVWPRTAAWTIPALKRRPNRHWGILGAFPTGLMLPYAVGFLVFAIVGSIVTCCGMPCGEGFPLFVCYTCYYRRRALVNALGLYEDHERSRCIVLALCPCSELQLWRELRNSGVWPGLMCCSPSDADVAAMAPDAVRARYAVNGVYAVQAAQRRPSQHTQDVLKLVEDLPPPLVAYTTAPCPMT